MIERTFVAVKPDGVQRGLVGEFIKRFENAGMKLVGMKMIWIDKDFAKEHYADHVEKAFYKPTEDYIVSGPVVAMVLEGVSAIEGVRKIVGPTEPGTAQPGTIRGDYAHHTFKYSDAKGKSCMNLIHASSSKEDASKEIDLWFSVEDLFKYTTDHQHHTQ